MTGTAGEAQGVQAVLSSDLLTDAPLQEAEHARSCPAARGIGTEGGHNAGVCEHRNLEGAGFPCVGGHCHAPPSSARDAVHTPTTPAPAEPLVREAACAGGDAVYERYRTSLPRRFWLLCATTSAHRNERALLLPPMRAGTLCTDGRLDLCKQVVGPKGIGPLLAALGDNDAVRALLIGNNIVGSEGARAIAAYLRSGNSKLLHWYIAGNNFNADDLDRIVDALISDPIAQSLWLKRNPLLPAGGRPIAKLLTANMPTLVTLDLVNTGLLDHGFAVVMRALPSNTALSHLYVASSVLSCAACGDLSVGSHLHCAGVCWTQLFVCLCVCVCWDHAQVRRQQRTHRRQRQAHLRPSCHWRKPPHDAFRLVQPLR